MIKKSKNGITVKICIAAVLLVVVVFYVYPLYWLLTTSLKDYREISSFSPPKTLMFGNYLKVFEQYKIVYIINSFLYTAVGILVSLLLSSIFAYAIARMKFRFRSILVIFVPVMMVISSTGLGGLAQFIMISKAHLRNTFFIIPLVFGVSGAAFCILIFYSFFRYLPYELEESGYMDGSSVARVFWSIIMPNSMPAIATLVIVMFMNNFNELYNSTIFIDSDYLKTITVGVVSFVQGRMIQYQLVAASLVISSIPTVVIYLSMSEQIEKALTVNTGLK